MMDVRLLNGDVQPLYFPDGHKKAGWFKGMAWQILVEQMHLVSRPSVEISNLSRSA
jgi:hypothetical protein